MTGASLHAPADAGDFADDCARYSRFWQAGAARLAGLPPWPRRSPGETQEAENIKAEARAARSRFLAAHAGTLYARLTHDCSRLVRVEQLVYDAEILHMRPEGAAVLGRVTVEGELTAEAEIFFAHLDKNRSAQLFGEHNFVFSGEMRYLLGRMTGLSKSSGTAPAPG